MENQSGPKSAVHGVVEDLKGRAKEAVGAVTDKVDLRHEGEAQRDKAAAEREVAAHEAEADAARGKAAAHEADQRAHQQ